MKNIDLMTEKELKKHAKVGVYLEWYLSKFDFIYDSTGDIFATNVDDFVSECDKILNVEGN